ncbi:hypothetical protein MDA_GLEAN10025311 [Myotis davidii]|uniref:Uncharacterized protein n=1 Tax=Myotis davidii TaxID=225400 RepID=L5M002_MYODS|nr:hypothetical protein MDA_GLEAN10025311 [Myotis davidii]
MVRFGDEVWVHINFQTNGKLLEASFIRRIISQLKEKSDV